jgi:hypothetical protein
MVENERLVMEFNSQEFGTVVQVGSDTSCCAGVGSDTSLNCDCLLGASGP